MENALESKLANIKRWKLGSKTAVHKPLLILYVLSQYKKGHKRLFNFEYEIYDQLRVLLDLYGQPVRSQHPEYPFWRLQKDGFWEVKTEYAISLTSSGDAPKKQLFESKAEGGFDSQFYNKLVSNEHVIDLLSLSLLKNDFTGNLHHALVKHFDINLTPFATEKVSEDLSVQYNYGSLLEELIAEFNEINL
ncbi:MAG: hypothetical protein HAW67_01665 [Endozoicomonadaceae bacterium]|nr:hypothetical protein [Endozoicomonadaceae bacterium]